MRTCSCAVLLLLFVAGVQWGTGLHAAQATVADSRQLDVVVTDETARSIRTLKATDFEVIDAGEARPVEDAHLQAAGRRVFAIFFDEYHVQSGESTARARAGLTRFVQTQVRDGDAIAVMKPLDPLNAIALTEDRDVVLRAISAFEGRKGDYVPRSTFEETFMSRDPRTAAISRAQVVSSALQALAARLGERPVARKALIVMSEGFAPALPRAITHAANRNGVAIHPIDPNPDATQTDEVLRLLADQTGGHASLNGADVAAALSRAVADLDGYYLLTYKPGSQPDGKYHTVHVRVKGTGLQARARAGYWARDPSPSPAASNAGSGRLLAPFRPPHSSPYVRPWIGMSRGAGGLTRVTVTWEGGAPPPRNQRVTSVSLKATGPDGRELFHQRIGAGDLNRAAFEATPGYLALEMAIQSSSGALLDTDYRTLSVPNLEVSRPTLATPQLMRTRTARGFATASADPNAVPVASRSFSRTERLLLRVPVYGAGNTTPVVTATLLNRRGIAMRELQTIPADLPAGIVQFDLPLASLAPDEYQIELRAANAQGAPDEARERLRFSVTH